MLWQLVKMGALVDYRSDGALSSDVASRAIVASYRRTKREIGYREAGSSIGMIGAAKSRSRDVAMGRPLLAIYASHRFRARVERRAPLRPPLPPHWGRMQRLRRQTTRVLLVRQHYVLIRNGLVRGRGVTEQQPVDERAWWAQLCQCN